MAGDGERWRSTFLNTMTSPTTGDVQLVYPLPPSPSPTPTRAHEMKLGNGGLAAQGQGGLIVGRREGW